jgi:hypothetical protein
MHACKSWQRLWLALAYHHTSQCPTMRACPVLPSADLYLRLVPSVVQLELLQLALHVECGPPRRQ